MTIKTAKMPMKINGVFECVGGFGMLSNGEPTPVFELDVLGVNE